jgi:hypothetical protein
LRSEVNAKTQGREGAREQRSKGAKEQRAESRPLTLALSHDGARGMADSSEFRYRTTHPITHSPLPEGGVEVVQGVADAEG